MSFFVSFDLVGLKCTLSETRIATLVFVFVFLSIFLVTLPPSLCFVSFHVKCVSWIQHTDGSFLFIQFASLCLLIGAFSPYTFNVNIAMYEFDPAF